MTWQEEMYQGQTLEHQTNYHLNPHTYIHTQKKLRKLRKLKGDSSVWTLLLQNSSTAKEEAYRHPKLGFITADPSPLHNSERSEHQKLEPRPWIKLSNRSLWWAWGLISKGKDVGGAGLLCCVDRWGFIQWGDTPYLGLGPSGLRSPEPPEWGGPGLIRKVKVGAAIMTRGAGGWVSRAHSPKMGAPSCHPPSKSEPCAQAEVMSNLRTPRLRAILDYRSLDIIEGERDAPHLTYKVHRRSGVLV